MENSILLKAGCILFWNPFGIFGGRGMWRFIFVEGLTSVLLDMIVMRLESSMMSLNCGN